MRRELLLDVLRALGDAFLDPGDVEEDAAVRASPPLAHLAHDAARHVVAGEQLRGATRRLVALRVAPPFFLVVRGLGAVVGRDVVEHEALAERVAQHPALAAHPFGHEDPLHARRPHHPGGMELHELHVDQLGASVVGERVAVAGVFPAVAGDLEGATDSASCKDDGPRREEAEAPALAIVGDRPADPLAVLEELDDGHLHVHVDAEVDRVVLQRADDLQPRAVADVGEAGIAVPAKVPLQDAPVGRAVEDRPPRLELAHAVRRLLGVQLGHAPVVHVLAAAHRVGEVDAPVVAVVHVPHRRGHAALGHDRVRLPQQRLADESHALSGGGGGNRRAQSGAARADHQDVVLDPLVFRH